MPELDGGPELEDSLGRRRQGSFLELRRLAESGALPVSSAALGDGRGGGGHRGVTSASCAKAAFEAGRFKDGAPLAPLPQRRCALGGCGAAAGLKACTGCSAVLYCCREHQLEHWPSHKAACKAAKKKKAGGGGASASVGGAVAFTTTMTMTIDRAID